jgi:hypothetical protein
MLQLLVTIVEMSALDEKLKAYLKVPNGSLDLHGLGPSSGYSFGTEGAEKVASFLLKW